MHSTWCSSREGVLAGDTFSRILDNSKQTWRLEQARILFSIETEMSEEERIKELGSYQVDIGGQKFVQVYTIDETYSKTDETDQ